ncbi:unnamed protein product [Polarella glacialis]|uniref:sn-1-specific diacylglycerol lipase n=1 Tax=Polarella glacialis TaxID=89957 RepID=A0A813D8Z9_POLGL|nr:unnamed protein product [Polarella glacialis]
MQVGGSPSVQVGCATPSAALPFCTPHSNGDSHAWSSAEEERRVPPGSSETTDLWPTLQMPFIRADRSVGVDEGHQMPFIHADMDPESPSLRRMRERTMVDEGRLRRHEGWWRCLMHCLCVGPGRDAELEAMAARRHELQRLAVVQHLALISAEYTHQSPSLGIWTRGMRALAKEAREEDEAEFIRKAPLPSLWPRSHFALDLGLRPPGRPFPTPSRAAGQWTRPPVLDIARAVAHFARFALAAYSTKMYGLVRPLEACFSCACCGGLSEHGAFSRLSGIDALEDILFAETHARPFRPAWWLVLDRASNSVVIAIRGTFSTSDVLSDALARQVHMGEHVVHEGVLASARSILHQVRPLLAGLHELRAGQMRLVVTGHSLGGAVASLLGYMLREEDGFRAQCFVYGAPQVVDKPLAERMERFVVSVIHDRDMVPRISRKSVEDLRNRVAAAAEPTEQRLARLEAVLVEHGLPREPDALRQVLAGQSPSRGGAAAAERGLPERQISSQSADGFEDAHENVSELPSLPMFNPGWQIHLQRRGLAFRKAQELKPILRRGTLRHFLLVASTPSSASLEMVRPGLTMWTDHFPQAYQFVCEEFAERMERVGEGATDSSSLANEAGSASTSGSSWALSRLCCCFGGALTSVPAAAGIPSRASYCQRTAPENRLQKTMPQVLSSLAVYFDPEGEVAL